STIVLALSAAFCFGLTCVLASLKPLWNDEVFTYYIAHQKTLPDLWRTLTSGAEQLPPLLALITRVFTAGAPHSRVALRLPEAIGFWLAGINLFCFARRRVPGVFALAAFLLPSLTNAFGYAMEARPYGLVLCFCSLALVGWQAAAENRNRSWSLLAFASGLALAVGCHYYAILALGPFVLAEGIRFYQWRRPDWSMYLAMTAAFLPLAVFLPLIRANMKYATTFWAKPQWITLVTFYESLLVPAALILFAFIVLAAMRAEPEATSQAARHPLSRIRGYEIAVVVGFVIIPVIAICLGKFVTGVFTDRYALPSVLGVSILITWSLARLSSRQALPGCAIFLACSCWFLFRVYDIRLQFLSIDQGRTSTYQLLQSEMTSSMPLVVASPHLFVEMSYLADIGHGARPVYLADLPLALHYTGSNSAEQNILGLEHFAPLDVQDFQQFCSAHRQFLLYSSTSEYEWVAKELLREQRKLTVKAQRGGELLSLVSSE
ncbi:MAG: glycosyltransferase family 39 protein, partial [Acidobacteriaceae bacterium]|nr:glycosyltransferase family 39 protein [Acidobacteriaceae bacterium]